MEDLDDTSDTTTPMAITTTPVTPASDTPMDKKMWYIIGGVGIVVLLIIIGQTIALCYFRRRAQPRRRMDDMTSPSRLERCDRARYSSPPCKKSKSSARAQADTDSHIYEMVGINALYHESSDLSEVPSDTAENNIRNRPPLPLPHEIPKPVPTETLPRKKPSPMTSMPSTLSLNSASSGSNLVSKKKEKELPPLPGQGFRKAPARPPKQIDGESMPGSLRRPAKPTPAPAPAAAPASAKTGPIPKTPSTQAAMSELNNVLKKRNVGKDTRDTPTASPAATVERKEPPKVQAKPSTLTNPQTQVKQPPSATTKPINQTNQIKLILPKIEACLKAPKPMVPKTVEPPVKAPPAPVKPSQVTHKPQKPAAQKPEAQKPVAQKPVTQPASKSVQNRPLPMPESARKLPPEPISPQPVPSLPPNQPPLPPRNQTNDEDLSRDTDDDEEWT